MGRKSEATTDDVLQRLTDLEGRLTRLEGSPFIRRELERGQAYAAAAAERLEAIRIREAEAAAAGPLRAALFAEFLANCCRQHPEGRSKLPAFLWSFEKFLSEKQAPQIHRLDGPDVLAALRKLDGVTVVEDPETLRRDGGVRLVGIYVLPQWRSWNDHGTANLEREAAYHQVFG